MLERIKLRQKCDSRMPGIFAFDGVSFGQSSRIGGIRNCDATGFCAIAIMIAAARRRDTGSARCTAAEAPMGKTSIDMYLGPRLRLYNILLMLGAIHLATTVAAQEIETGGPIPDRRAFLGDKDPRYPAVLRAGLATRRVAGHVYVVAGAGGNIAVQAGDEGVLLVDNNFTLFYDRIVASIRSISDGPIRIVVNTHFHPDSECS